MKTHLLLTLFLTPLLSFAQRDTSIYRAGTELIKFERQYTAGSVLQIAGSAILAIGAVADNTTIQKPVIIAGGLLALIGFGVQISSTSHVKNAGIYLRRNKLVIPLSR